MAQNKPLSYWMQLKKEYEGIINDTTDNNHKESVKEGLKVVNQKIKDLSVKRDFATKIPLTVKRKWNTVQLRHPRATKQIHIIEYTGLSKPIVVRAMTDSMATNNTLNKIEAFFNYIKTKDGK
ncbi:hypothetical protein UFOVP87_31 [uncultured Caudovirales phage]|uniref:Uncharacterized protein n=1 Tax=uncultured Caudovirales phage TaxID=2100421 RepID=A0A6J5KX15_9CAUD|nr:hypothetical protein UFOVP87_31 [uncultured Caudovirales phage]